MTTTVNASTSAGLVLTPDTSGSLALQTANTNALTIDSSQKVSFVNDASISGLTVGKGANGITYNTAVGGNALSSGSLSGNYNTGLGYNALASNTSGAASVAVGLEALKLNTTGSNNVSVGQQALLNNTTGSNSVAVGYQASYTNSTGRWITSVGYQAGYSGTVDFQTNFGAFAGFGQTTGINNFFGAYTGYATTTGQSNAGFGGYDGSTLPALRYNTTGSANSAFGIGALANNTTGNNNTAVGYQAGYSNTTAGYSTFVGYQSGYSSNHTSDAFANNTFIGALAGYNVTTGQKNTILGLYNGNQGGLDIRTASNYIVLSDGDGNPRGIFDGSGRFLINTVSYTTSYNSTLAVKSVGDNVCAEFWRQGTTSGSGIVTFQSNAGGSNTLKSYIDTSSGLLVAVSDERNKENLTPITNALNKIITLRTVVGNYKNDATKHPFLIAQDVQKILPEAVSEQNDEQKTLGLSYVDVIPLLVASIRELNATVTAQATTIQEQQTLISDLTNRTATLEAK
jgi:hypothetical protein